MKPRKSIAAVTFLTAALVAVAAPASFAAVSAGSVMLASSDTPNMYAPQEDDTSLSGTMPPSAGATGAAPGSDTAAPDINQAPGGAVTPPETQQPGAPAVPPLAAPETQAPPVQEPPAATVPQAPEQPAADQGQEDHKKRRLKNYAVLKGGLYVPSRTFDLDTLNPNISNGRAHFQTKTGFAGEIAVGHYLIPELALEFGTGYFQRNSDATMVRVVPITLSAKVCLPLGPFEPFGLAGIGGYVADQDIKGTSLGTTDLTYGFQLGAGFDVNVHRNAFVGLEGKYLWSEPSFKGQNVRLDGFITTVNLGFRF